MTGHERVWRDVILATTFFYLVMVFFLTSRHGLEGTAAGTALGLLFGACVALLAVWRSLAAGPLITRSAAQETPS